MAGNPEAADPLERYAGVGRAVADSLRFKRKLAIGEEAYSSLRVARTLSQVKDIGAAATAGALVAGSSAVAGTFFGGSGLLAAIGIGAAATPVGWIAAAAVASGGAYYGVSRLLGRYGESRVEVIPKFINSPIDQLGAALLDMMASLSLKVTQIDGTTDPVEREAMTEYFVEEWGYDRAFVKAAITQLEESNANQSIKSLIAPIAKFVVEHPDCNQAAFKAELLLLLKEVAEADGKLDEREELAIDAIGSQFVL